MNRIQVREVELEGFGLYHRRTRFNFAPGLNVLIAPNEMGKSTFMNGLLATLFGLPEKSDPEAWGTTRYRNWETPLYFRSRTILHTGTTWHQIKRDFATHSVQWSTTASALLEAVQTGENEADSQPAGLIPLVKPKEMDWLIRFDEEHNPAGRGESVRRYQKYLYDLLGIEDRELFLLTYCMTQDPEDRHADEIDFRTRKVPESVQGLISGSGGQVDEVLTELFNQFGAVTMGTADAGLIRPGKNRALNLRKNGRLENVIEQLRDRRGQLAAAEINLEDLQSSHERLEMIRQEEEECRLALLQDRKLLKGWDEWSRIRKEQRILHKQISTLDRAINELDEQQGQVRDIERELKESYPEYLSSNFSFLEKDKDLTNLVALEREAVSNRELLEEALEQQREMDRYLVEQNELIEKDLAPFEHNNDLLRDFDQWQKSHGEMVRLEVDLKGLSGSEKKQKEIIETCGLWNRLVEDDAAGSELTSGAKLQQMQRSLPPWLDRLDEIEQLTDELTDLHASLAGELAVVGEISPERRQEAEAYKDRHALYRIEAEKSVQHLEDLQNKCDEARRKETLVSDLKTVIDSQLSGTKFDGEAEIPLDEEPGTRELDQYNEPPTSFSQAADPDPEAQDASTEALDVNNRIQNQDDDVENADAEVENPDGGIDNADAGIDRGDSKILPGPWTRACQLLKKKLQSEREQASLVQRIDEIQTGLRAGWWRKMGLPATIALILCGACGVMAGHMLELPPLFSVSGGVAAALIAAGLTLLIISRGRRDGHVHEQRSARGRLVSVRRTLEQVNVDLTELANLEAEAVENLLQQFRDYERLAADITPLLAVSPTKAEIDEAAEKANQMREDLFDFEERMSELGSEPHTLVALWRGTERRAQESRKRLEELGAQIGILDWQECKLNQLPESWNDYRRLSEIVFRQLPSRDDEPQPEESGRTRESTFPSTGGDLVLILRRIDDEMWGQWIIEAKSLEAAIRELKEIGITRQAMQASSSDNEARLDQLRTQEVKLAAQCVPFTLETKREDIAEADETYQKIRHERDQGQTLLTSLTEKMPELQNKVTTAKTNSDNLRDTLRGLLQPAGGDPVLALERLREAERLQLENKHAVDAVQQVIQSHDADSIESLQVKLAGVREENHQQIKDKRELEDRFVALRELDEMNADQMQKHHDDLGQRIEQSEQQLHTLLETRENVQKRASDARAEGDRVGNAAILELEIAELTAEEERLYIERDTIRIAFETMREAENRFGKTYREQMEERARTIFRDISLKPERSVLVDERFQIKVVEKDGQPCVLRQLSQGARDQLAIALRLAVADLLSDGGRPPLILDDPFLSFDPERLEAIREALERIALDRQVILLSHRPRLGEWGYAVTPVEPDKTG